MRLTPPKKNIWWLSVALGVVGIVLEIVSLVTAMNILSIIGFWVVVVGLVLLALSTAIKGL
ncbi:MAG: hypothetical protein QHH80_14410 [Anaerolineae bacterium]|jgi:uncharacterized membrane protein HdeD (DUF308 family)|nr:hypothetical protein [Anaerolineae bacterium]